MQTSKSAWISFPTLFWRSGGGFLLGHRPHKGTALHSAFLTPAVVYLWSGSSTLPPPPSAQTGPGPRSRPPWIWTSPSPGSDRCGSPSSSKAAPLRSTRLAIHSTVRRHSHLGLSNSGGKPFRPPTRGPAPNCRRPPPLLPPGGSGTTLFQWFFLAGASFMGLGHRRPLRRKKKTTTTKSVVDFPWE